MTTLTPDTRARSDLETLLAASVRLVQLERENALLRAQLKIANLKLERERARTSIESRISRTQP